MESGTAIIAAGETGVAIEQMNISLSPHMARFIRGKARKGEYTNMSEVVRDAVRRLQEDETVKSARTWLHGLRGQPDEKRT